MVEPVPIGINDQGLTFDIYWLIIEWSYFLSVDGIDAATQPVEPERFVERNYPGVNSDYDYRQWTVERMRLDAERIMRSMNATYDQVAWVPRDKVSYDNTLKPMIDLTGEVHWQSGVITVSNSSIKS